MINNDDLLYDERVQEFIRIQAQELSKAIIANSIDIVKEITSQSKRYNMMTEAYSGLLSDKILANSFNKTDKT